jgi:uncharacterized protein YraI
MTINLKPLMYAAGILTLSAGMAAAAPARVATDLNVRAGQGTGYPVVSVMPAGAIVDVRGCGDGWCYVPEYGGYASASYLDGGNVVYGGTTYVAPPPVYVAPSVTYRDPARRIIRREVREFRRDLRQDRRRDARQEMRQDRREARQDARQDRRQDARQDRRENRREARQERRENRRNN